MSLWEDYRDEETLDMYFLEEGEDSEDDGYYELDFTRWDTDEEDER